jgi:hypothetical protein
VYIFTGFMILVGTVLTLQMGNLQLLHGAGQSLEYAATEAEAREYIARPTNDPEDWPWLNAERVAAGGTSTILQVAQQVLEMAAAWRSVGSEIKRTRRTAKIAIESATSVLSVREVVSALDWPLPG